MKFYSVTLIMVDFKFGISGIAGSVVTRFSVILVLNLTS